MKNTILLISIVVLTAVTSWFIHKNIPGFVISCLLAFAMAWITISDLRHFLIPDKISLPMIPAGIFASGLLAEDLPVQNIILQSSLSAIWGFGLFYLIKIAYQRYRNRNGLGMGDVKLAALAGAWTGFFGLNFVILSASLLALTIILGRHLAGHKITAKSPIPYGAFLAPAIWMVWSLQTMGILERWIT